MDYNRGIALRINWFIRNHFICPKMRKRLYYVSGGYTILSSACLGGRVYHDLGLQFQSPTINLWFGREDFLDFVEQFDYYIDRPIVQVPNPHYTPGEPDYPVGLLKGDLNHKDLVLHFNHYNSFEMALEAWNRRKQRINLDRIVVIHHIAVVKRDKSIYDRYQALPVEKKIIFVNHPIDNKKYKNFFYIKGFEDQEALGNIMTFMNLKGQMYYDQFDFVEWLNN